MSSFTLKTILENWIGEVPTDDDHLVLPFDLENVCRTLDPHADLLPVLEQMAEALCAQQIDAVKCTEVDQWIISKFAWDKARAALAAYHAWRGEK